MTHGDLIEEILRLAPDHDARLFKNPSGVAVYKKEGRTWRVPYGVGPHGGGGHDVIGWRSVVITPDMVGRRLPVFASIDAKVGDDRLSEQQIKWGNWVDRAGGLAGEARSLQDAIDILTGVKPWQRSRK
jgi:hypothetical protein